MKPRKSGLKTRKLKSTGGRPVIEYLLNEDQALFLGTLFRNNEKVVLFKKTVIRELRRMKEALLSAKTQHSDINWIETRNQGKTQRLEATNTIKEFIEYAEKQGSKNANYYYTNITRMMNNTLFIVTGKFKSLRNFLTPRQLMVISAAEGIIDKTLRDNMNRNIYYKDIYKLVKKNIMLFAELHGQSEVILEGLLIE